MGFRIYNTLSRKVEDFEPIEAGRVRMYVCGPTVYGHAHLGHGKSYVSFDVLLRYLRYLGFSVSYVQNITDVGHLTDDADAGEDKLDKQARAEHKHPMAIAEYYTRSYFEDMDTLNCLRPDISPRATGHIPEQIELVERLLEKGYAYEAGGSVYFDVSKFAGYGKLSGRNVEDMQAGARVDVNTEKRHPADFALWKKAEANHVMQWHSPWGRGYPGWHLECSVMSMKYLGETIDIHGGGIENQFPHHECEIAQSEAANDKPFVKYWVHHNMVTVDGQKMGKSLGNFIMLKEIFDNSGVEKHARLSRKYSPLAVRQLILQSHYRSPIDFSDAALTAAQSGYDKITGTVISLRQKWNSAPDGQEDQNIVSELKLLKDKFEEAMNDDLNTSVALSVIFELVRLSNKVMDATNTSKATFDLVDRTFRKLGGDVLGIVKDSYAMDQVTAAEQDRLRIIVESMIEQRKQARAQKDYEKSDNIRKTLEEAKIILRDNADGTSSWSITQINP